MNRRKFIQATSIVATGFAIAPQFASATVKKLKKVILVILSGGIRLNDATNEKIMPLFFGKENGVVKKGVFFNNVHYSGTEISLLQSKYALLHGTTKIDSDYLNQPEQSKISSGYVYINTDLKDVEKFNTSLNYATNVDNASFIVVNVEGADVAHYNFSEYQNHLKRVDEFLKNIYNTNIESKEDFSLVIVSEHGRNNNQNSMGGLDHYQPEARNTFAWIAGTNKKLKTNTTIETAIDTTETMYFCESLLNKKNSKQTLILNSAFA